MSIATPAKLITAAEFMEMDLGKGQFELVRGEIVEMPQPQPRHGRVCSTVSFLLESYGRASGNGYTLTNDVAIQTEWGPDTVRGADVMYYSHARLPLEQLGGKSAPIPPDLIVEVLSPSNRRSEMLEKVVEYLGAGVGLVWLVNPRQGSVTIYRDADADTNDVTLFDADVIENLPELPGFSCKVAEFFK